MSKTSNIIKQARIVGKLENIQILLRTIESELALCRDEVSSFQVEKTLTSATSDVFDVAQKIQEAKNWALSELVRLEQDVKPA